MKGELCWKRVAAIEDQRWSKDDLARLHGECILAKKSRSLTWVWKFSSSSHKQEKNVFKCYKFQDFQMIDLNVSKTLYESSTALGFKRSMHIEEGKEVYIIYISIYIYMYYLPMSPNLLWWLYITLNISWGTCLLSNWSRHLPYNIGADPQTTLVSWHHKVFKNQFSKPGSSAACKAAGGGQGELGETSMSRHVDVYKWKWNNLLRRDDKIEN